MKNRKTLLSSLSVLAVIAIIGGLSLWMRGSAPTEKTSQEITRPAPSEQKAPLPLPVTEASRPKNSDNSNEDQMINLMKFQMADIAEQYRKNMQYPEYSKPLQKNDWSLLNPRAFIPREAPLGDHPGLSASIILDQYIVNRDKDLPVKMIIKGQDDNAYPTGVALFLIADGDSRPLVNLNETDWDGEVSIYSGSVPAAMIRDVKADEVVLKAKISISNHEDAIVTTVIKLFGNEATLTHLGNPYVENADLIIPAYFDVNNPGRYSVQANLFDASGKEPVSHLNSVFQLSGDNNSGLIKVHASTLRSKGNPGPYLLKDFNITKKPSNPGDKTGYGSSASDSFIIDGFPLGSYSDEPYEDPKNKQRLEFLQKLAGSQ